MTSTILAEAERLVLRGERQHAYGAPVEAMRRVARWWELVDEQPHTAREVALKLVALKLAREAHRHDSDNLVDAAGYLLIAELCAESEEPPA